MAAPAEALAAAGQRPAPRTRGRLQHARETDQLCRVISADLAREEARQGRRRRSGRPATDEEQVATERAAAHVKRAELSKSATQEQCTQQQQEEAEEEAQEEAEEAEAEAEEWECCICFDDVSPNDAVRCGTAAAHAVCRGCLASHVKHECRADVSTDELARRGRSDGRVLCPVPGCDHAYRPRQIAMLDGEGEGEGEGDGEGEGGGGDEASSAFALYLRLRMRLQEQVSAALPARRGR